MSYYAQQQAPPPQGIPLSIFSRSNEVRKHAAYPPPPSSYPPPEQAPTYVAPPPAGYPTRDGGLSSAPVPIETKSRGDGFWKGW
ncbi:unnamed protein product [Musa acuminata subsp. burmannicoides]